jgi:hypothetical protein
MSRRLRKGTGRDLLLLNPIYTMISMELSIKTMSLSKIITITPLLAPFSFLKPSWTI